MKGTKMKTAILIGMFLSFATIAQAVTIDGHAYLDGESVHDGIEVVFERTAPSPLFDTTYTDISGYYSVDVEAGIYDLDFFKTGYLEAHIEDIVAYSSLTIPDTTLEHSGISGALTGTLATGTYNVDADINVPVGETLIVEPGTILRFREGIRFIVNGVLYANGTETDSIIFTPIDTSITWGGILLQNSSDGSRMSYCVVEYCAGNGIESDYPYGIDGFVIEKSRINYCGDRGLNLRGDNIIIQSVVVNYNHKGIWIFADSLIIKNSEISKNADDGLVLTNPINAVVENCMVIGNGPNAKGIYCYGCSPETYIINCHIVGNRPSSASGAIYIYHGTPVILNCLIADNQGNGIYFDGATDSKLFNNNIWNNDIVFHGSGPVLFGENVTTNANGDSCDPYSNILFDPMFVDTSSGDYRLLPGSPCLDAGIEFIVISDDTVWAPHDDYDGTFRPYGSRWDIGVYEGPSTGIEEGGNKGLKPLAYEISAYPNPFNSAVTISLSVIPGLIRNPKIEIFDINGRMVYETPVGAGLKPARAGGSETLPYEIVWTPDASIGSGVYLVRACFDSAQRPIDGVAAVKRVVYLK